ncbi:MAG: preprotein translocase subunit YajC [Clostridia bacterium]|nr:preprotein translocase subunit YajC [Clostridia bacterium]
MLNLTNLLAEANQAVAVTAPEANAAATTATGTPTAVAGGGDLIMTIVMMVAMVAIFYFLLIRPQRKKDKQVKNMLAALKVGDRICTIGGLYGTIAALKDDTVTLTMGSLQNTIVIARWAIRSVENVALENDTEPQI